jgi:hypothetical protein
MSDNQRKRHERKAQQAVTKAQVNRDKARKKLLRQRRKLARRRARNRRQSEKRRDEQTEDGETSTTHSTLPPQKSNAENAARNSHSTVPETVKHSNVPARERLYGQRLHRHTSQDGDTTPTPAGSTGTDIETEASTDE